MNKIRVVIAAQFPLDINNIQGGVESCIVGIIKEFKSIKGLELHVITLSNKIRTPEELLINGVTIHYIPSPKLPQLITALTIDQYRIRKEIDKIKPDLVNAHMTAPLYGYPALKSDYPTVITVHGIVSEESKSWNGFVGFVKKILYVPMEKYVLANANYITTVSPYVVQKIEDNCKSNIYVIPNGISCDRFEVENMEIENRLLFVGGIEPRKSLLNLFKAIHLIKDDYPNLQLHIVGNIRKKEYYKDLFKYVVDNNLSKQIYFKGSLSHEDLVREYSECSVFVFPSKEESQGIVLLEAMAAGKPVVATNVGGIPYVLDDGITGLLAEHGNVEDLASNIQKLLNNKDLRSTFGHNGKKKAKSFLNKRISEKYCEIYVKLGVKNEHNR